jgi:geranylgeranyl diphosphate synthase, type I
MENKMQFWPLIEENIHRFIEEKSFETLTMQMIKYQMDLGGKRLRPRLAIEINKAFGGDLDRILPFAGAVEIIHNASLVHDDIQDGDVERRGQIAAWRKFSTNQAINLGDILMTVALEMVLNTGSGPKTEVKLVRLVLNAMTQLINGQILDISFEDSNEILISDYYKIISGKTAALFQLAASGAVLISGVSQSEVIEDMEKLGSHLGRLFQMRDDIIEVTGKKDGRERRSDIVDGKASLCHVLALQELSPAKTKHYKELLGQAREDKECCKICLLFKEEGIVKKAQDMFFAECETVIGLKSIKQTISLNNYISNLVTQLSSGLEN